MDVSPLAPVGLQHACMERVHLPRGPRVLGALVRASRRRDVRALDERDAELGRAAPQRVVRRIRTRADVVGQGPAVLGRVRAQLERLPVELDVVARAQLLDLDEADIAPRSNEIGPDADRRGHLAPTIPRTTTLPSHATARRHAVGIVPACCTNESFVRRSAAVLGASPVILADPAHDVATERLGALKTAARCDDATSPWRPWCVAAAYDTGTAAALPAGKVLVGLTIELETGKDVATALSDKVSFTAW